MTGDMDKGKGCVKKSGSAKRKVEVQCEERVSKNMWEMEER